MSGEHQPGRAVWVITGEQLARGYWRKLDDDTISGPYPYVVLAKLDDGTFEVEVPPDDALEDRDS